MPRLEYIDNAGSKSVLNLDDGVSVSIGRNPGSSVHTTNPSVSRNHGRIYKKAGRWIVKDLGSSNGTFINDEPVQQSKLDDGDLIRCGDFVLHFLDDGQAIPDTPRKSNGSRRGAPSQRKRARGTKDPFSFTDDELDARPKKQRGTGDVPAQQTLRPRNLSPTEAKLKAPERGERVEIEEPRKSRRSRDRNQERSRDRDSAKSRRRTRNRRDADEAPERSASEERLVRQIKEQAEEIDQLSRDLDESKSMVSSLEAKLEDNESRSTRYEVELDSITEKYVQIKDQLTLSRERLDETREELADKEDKIFQLESRIGELDTELESARERATGSAEVTANFKIKLTQKDRQIEELQRQYDLLEFEFRAVREELQALQEGYNADAGDTAKLERKINQLREIIADKENVISQLRLELENKDIEIRQVRMGMGMTDLEDEKRKLLEDYYEKNREADQLRDEQKNLQVELEDVRDRLKEVEGELERKSEAMSDISSHPDYKARVREVRRLEEQISELEGDLGAAEEKLGAFTAEDKKRLQGEVAFHKRKASTIEDKLKSAQERIGELEDEVAELNDRPAPAAPEPEPPSEEAIEERVGALKTELAEDLEGVYEMFVQWRSNFSLLETYMEEISAAMEALEGEPKEAGDEALESVTDLLRVVESDSKALRRGLKSFEKKVK